MREQAIFISIIISLVGVIILLAALLLQPTPTPPALTFDYVMNRTAELREGLSNVNITYTVNLTLNNTNVIGEMNYYKSDSSITVTLSPELVPYDGTGLIIPPDQLIDYIQENKREEYSGELISYETNELCWSTTTEPTGTQYDKLINGEFLFVTCFNKTTGYPSLMYNSELTSEEVIYSKSYIKDISFA